MQGTAIDDPTQQLGQGLHLQATTMDLDPRYHPWSGLAPSYPYRSPLGTDGGVPTDSLTSEDTNQHLLLEAHTTHHFRSMHLRAAPHPARRSPPNVSGMHRLHPSPIPGSDPMQDPTRTNATAANVAAITMDHTANQAAEMYAHIALGGDQVPLGTNTAQSLALNLDGSQSWSSAMTPMLNQQYDQFYQYQAARLGQQPRQASSQAHNNSHSTTGHHLQQAEQPSPQQQQQQQQQHSPPARSTSSAAGGAHRYSQELRQQQEEQLRIQLRQQAVERERRASEEEQFMMHMSEAFRQPSSVSTSSAGSGRPSPPHLHPEHLEHLQQQQQADPHSHGQPFYATHHPAVYVGDMAAQGLQDGDLDRLVLDMDGPAYGHQQGADHQAYPLVDGHLHQLGLQAESQLE